MGRYLLRRLLQLVPVFIGTTFLIYWLVWSVPGDPFAGKCGDRGCPPNYLAMMTEKYHLDESIWVQYASYMKNLFQGDFGITFGGREISDIIATSYPNTLKLAVVALAIEARHRSRRRRPDAVCGATASWTTWSWSPPCS